MRKAIKIFSVVVIAILLLVSCSPKGSSSESEPLKERMDRHLKQQMTEAEHNGKSIKVIWGYELKILKEASKPYWTGRIIYVRGGYLRAKAEVRKDFNESGYFIKRGETKQADIVFMHGYGVENGEVVIENFKVVDILFEDEPGYSERKKELTREMKSDPFEHWG